MRRGMMLLFSVLMLIVGGFACSRRLKTGQWS